MVRRARPASKFVEWLIRLGFKRRALIKRRESLLDPLVQTLAAASQSNGIAAADGAPPVSTSGETTADDARRYRSAEEVEQLVTTPLEKMLYQIDGVEYVYSMSRPGMAVVTVRFSVRHSAMPLPWRVVTATALTSQSTCTAAISSRLAIRRWLRR